jgi:phage/plasmid-associated DNA primase
VLRHIQGKFQIKESPFCGACKFDGNDILIAVANGVLRMSVNTAQPILESFASNHHFTQKLAAQFDPEAKCPAFSRALSQNLPDPLDRRLFGLFCASCFVPDCRREAALCSFGETGTGKSTPFEGIEAMLGKGPCQSLSLTQLCDPERSV